jgi:DNA-directed RNA polymerase specialized sigma24 family protein
MADPTPTSYAPLSEAELEAQLKKHGPLISCAVARYKRIYPHLAEDIEQEARIALADAIRTYDPATAPTYRDSSLATLRITFGTYATRQMRWHVLNFLNRLKVSKDAHTVGLDEPTGEGGDATRADLFDAQAAARETSEGIADENLLKRIHDLRFAVASCRNLTRTERTVVKKFLEVGSVERAALALYRTPQSVSQALKHAVAKLRKHPNLSP